MSGTTTRFCVSLFCMSACGLQVAHASDDPAPIGFVNGSSLNILLRNNYYHYTGDYPAQRDWAQGAMANFRSGFTEGTIGFGIDAFAYGAIKLDGGAGRGGTRYIPTDSDAEPVGSYGKSGASLKIKYSNTVLSYGDLEPLTPFFAIGDFDLLNQTATGFMIDSNEIQGVQFEAGRFTSETGTLSTGSGGPIVLVYANVNTPSVSYAGV